MRIPLCVAVGLSSLMSTGCALSEEKFQDRYFEAMCELYVNCLPEGDESDLTFDSVEDCVTIFSIVRDDYYEDCEYDAEQGKACLDGFEAYAEECESTDADDATWAAACIAVYDCPDAGGGADTAR